MNDAVASLQAIRDGFAALREELAETKAALQAANARIAELEAQLEAAREG